MDALINYEAVTEKDTLPVPLIQEALQELNRRRPELERYDRYARGVHEMPWLPKDADDEYKTLMSRAATNVIGLVVDASAQALRVDNFRRAGEGLLESADRSTPADSGVQDGEAFGVDSGVSGRADWEHWRTSRLESRQVALIRSACVMGVAFVATEKRPDGQVISRPLSPLHTTALFDDPVSDVDPVAALHVLRYPEGKRDGELLWWNTETVYRVRWARGSEGSRFTVKESKPHGAHVCPVTRVPLYLDLEGECRGLVEPLLIPQDRLNQSVGDLLVAESYTAWEVRTVAGAAPPVKMERAADGTMRPVLDADGKPIPDRAEVSSRRWLFNRNPDVKYGHLPAGDLRPLIAAVELAMRHISAIAQVPPHYLLGEIANVSADGLTAAAVGLDRKNAELATLLGEGLERVFRVAADMRGDFDAREPVDYGEVVWADRSNQSIGAVADALGKFAQMLGVPSRALWTQIPGMTRAQLDEWTRLWREEHGDIQGRLNTVTDADFENLFAELEEGPDGGAAPVAGEAE